MISFKKKNEVFKAKIQISWTKQKGNEINKMKRNFDLPESPKEKEKNKE
jgi:hypothetical protein